VWSTFRVALPHRFLGNFELLYVLIVIEKILFYSRLKRCLET
jgi:hypothetical protein